MQNRRCANLGRGKHGDAELPLHGVSMRKQLSISVAEPVCPAALALLICFTFKGCVTCQVWRGPMKWSRGTTSQMPNQATL